MKCQGVVAAAFLGAVCAQLDSLPPCGITCVNNVIAKGFGCASGDNTCLCKQQDFVFGIRDCAAQSCAAAETAKVNDYVTGLCATATKAPPASTPPASSPAPSAPAQQQTTPPSPPSSTSLPLSPLASTAASNQASAPNPPSSSAATSAAPSEPPRKSITEAAQATQLPTTAPTTLTTSLKLQTSRATSSTTSASIGTRPSPSGSAPSAGAENLTSEAAGLSMPAKVGIGVGAGVGVLAIALALWLLIRRPKKPVTLHADIWPNAGFWKGLYGRNRQHEGEESFGTGDEVKTIRRHGTTPVTEALDMKRLTEESLRPKITRVSHGLRGGCSSESHGVGRFACQFASNGEPSMASTPGMHAGWEDIISVTNYD